MRAGGCTLQQALTVEAASIVMQAVSLARRRGHAQVTPLHVANTMLASSTGLLRTACLQSHSHPLQCKALELCFNVALNRLPATSSSPMLGHHVHHSSLSNALMATFKRAQAHQRRGSTENQQQPLLASKVELEQLIISILDDPSVSRVMREAGFSSTQVKSNVEQAVSLEICEPNSSVTMSKDGGDLLVPMGKLGVKAIKARSEDVMCVVENLVDRRKKSTVIVGECLASSEDIVRGVMDKVDKGEVPEALRNVQFISFPLFSCGHLSKEEVEQKLGDIRSLVKSCLGRGVVLYLGDLKWAAGYMANEQRSNYNYHVEHMIMEIGRLVCGVGESRMLRLLGIATYQTYMRCRIGHPSLESIWYLHPLTVPTGSLGLSLSPDSDGQLKNANAGDGLGWPLLQNGLEKPLTFFADCLSKFESEVHSLPNSTTHHSSTTSSSTLPPWLQQYKEENKTLISNDQDCLQVRHLCKKGNSVGNSAHKHHHNPHPPERTLSFSSISPSSSISSLDQHYPNLHQTHQTWPLAVDPKHPWKGHHFLISNTVDEFYESDSTRFRDPKPVHLAKHNHNMSPNSASSRNTMAMDYLQRFKELNAENLKTLCNALEEKVSWKLDIIPQIASTILQCRSGMIRRQGKLKPSETKEDTWLFFEGDDTDTKEKIARELASLIFGSQTNFISIGSSTFSSPARSDFSDDFRNKRSRAESSCSYLERFADAISSNPHRVFLIEDIEQVDNYSQLGIKSVIERGAIRNSNGDEVRLCDAIIIFSCECFDSRSRESSPIKHRSNTEEGKVVEFEKEVSPYVSLDLNLSFEDMNEASVDNMDLLESVDGRFVFKLWDEL